MGQLASFISGPVTSCEMEDGYNKAVVYNNDNTKKAFKDLVQHYCRPIGVDGDLYVLKLVVPINIKAQIYTWTFSLYWIKSMQVWGGEEIKWGSFTNALCILCIQKQILFNLYFLSPKRWIWMSNYFLSRSATKWRLWHWREFAIDIGGELKLTAFEHRWTAVTIIDYHLNNLQMSLNIFGAANQQIWIDKNINCVCVWCTLHGV